MPRVKYTAGKGLYQEAGSGIDITGTLEITGEIRGSKKELVQVTTTLTLADSGAVLIPTGAAKTFTLPAVATAAGFHVTFQAGSAAAHVINGGGSKIQGAIYDNTAASATFVRNAVTNASSITLATPAIGDYLTIVGDGTNYYVFGWCNDTPVIA